MLSIIAALAENNAIGLNNALLWKLPNDMKRFRELTVGHTVIMGRKTFESLPNGALPDRTNVVLTRNSAAIVPVGCKIAGNVQDAVRDCGRGDGEVFIIGGASLYRQTIDIADKLYITRVRRTFDHADTFFPAIDENQWLLTQQDDFPADDRHACPYTFQTYILRKK